MMLLAASPGGTTANLYSHFANGDVALNITLTAVNSILAVVTLPLIVNLALVHFMGKDQTIPLQFDKVLQVFAIVLVRWRSACGSARAFPIRDALKKPSRRIGSVPVRVIALAMVKDWRTLAEYAP